MSSKTEIMHSCEKFSFSFTPDNDDGLNYLSPGEIWYYDPQPPERSRGESDRKEWLGN